MITGGGEVTGGGRSAWTTESGAFAQRRLAAAVPPAAPAPAPAAARAAGAGLGRRLLDGLGAGGDPGGGGGGTTAGVPATGGVAVPVGGAAPAARLGGTGTLLDRLVVQDDPA